MQPQVPTAQPQQSQPLDPQAVALAQAIRKTETNDNFNAKGKSGESGAYQWLPQTWQAHAKQVLGDPNAEMTPSNQNAVAYTIIKGWKDQGLNPAQIAAKWNSGSEVGWENKVGTNSQGVHFNVPQYVKSVTDAYQQFKLGNTNPNVTPNASTVSNQSQGNRDWLQKSADVVSSIFPGGKIGEALSPYTAKLFNSLEGHSERNQFVQGSQVSPLQVAGDVGQIALTLGGGLPETGAIGGALSKIPGLGAISKASEGVLGNVGLGAAFGATGAVANGATNPSDIAANSILGGGLGLAGAGASKAIGTAISKLPTRIIQKVLPSLDKEGADYALNSLSLGKPENMLRDSQNSIKSMGSSINSILTGPEYRNTVLNSENVITDVLGKFPNSNYTKGDIIDTIKGIVPNVEKLVDKIDTGTASLSEGNTVRQAIDAVTGRFYTKSSVLPARQEIIKSFARTLSTEIQKTASETQPLFEKISNELDVRDALRKLTASQEKKSFVGLKDILWGIGGGIAHGPVGALTTMAGEKLLKNPSVDVLAAKGINQLNKAKPVVGQLNKGLRSPLFRALTNQK